MVRSSFICALLLILQLGAGNSAYGETIAEPKSDSSNSTTRDSAGSAPWWKHAVIYEIYPRSFADGKNCGMGNLKGITEKLDYLSDLGVDAIWLTPCYPSPQVDFGYDISDYCAIDPQYGTIEEFDILVKEAEKRKIKVLMDLVLNHSSDHHPWFIESRSSRDNAKRDWYIWRDGKDSSGTKPPNNWLSLFGGPAWEWDEKTKQYYYHFFYKQQPDLNWRNADLRKAMYDVVRFWLDRGVAGFRLDAITTSYEDPSLKDNPIKPGTNAYGDPNMDYKYNYRLPEVHDLLRELRQVSNSYSGDRVLIGETSVDNVDQLSQMYGKNDDEVQLPMNFFFAYVNKLSAPEFRQRIREADNNIAHGQPVYLFSNHDQVRHYVRYGDGQHNDQIAKLMSALLLTLRGTPILYYGEEIGMENKDPVRKEDVKDPIGIVGWPKEKGRDGERTPMQWSAETNAGFSTVKPWLPVAENYKTHNVRSESDDPASILNFYKRLIKLRRENHALKYGDYIELDRENTNVLSFLRKHGQKAVVITLNMSDKPQDIKLNLEPSGFSSGKADTLLSSVTDVPEKLELEKIHLSPFAAVIAEVE